MRVYLPATLPRLAAVAAAREIGPPPLTAFAVTPALREWYAEADGEELEYAAYTEAARASLRLLAQDPAAPRRRVVLAADVPDAAVGGGGASRAGVEVRLPVPLAAVASVHVDDEAAAATVAAAALAVTAADDGDDDAEFTVGTAADHELAWYATQELPDLLDSAL